MARRIEKSIIKWRQDLARAEKMRKGTVLGRKYQVIKRGWLW